jgi:hypothetical protein
MASRAAPQVRHRASLPDSSSSVDAVALAFVVFAGMAAVKRSEAFSSSSPARAAPSASSLSSMAR